MRATSTALHARPPPRWRRVARRACMGHRATVQDLRGRALRRVHTGGSNAHQSWVIVPPRGHDSYASSCRGCWCGASHVSRRYAVERDKRLEARPEGFAQRVPAPAPHGRARWWCGGGRVGATGLGRESRMTPKYAAALLTEAPPRTWSCELPRVQYRGFWHALRCGVSGRCSQTRRRVRAHTYTYPLCVVGMSASRMTWPPKTSGSPPCYATRGRNLRECRARAGWCVSCVAQPAQRPASGSGVRMASRPGPAHEFGGVPEDVHV